MRREDISFLEELNFNAWPAVRTAYFDGWLLRSTVGDSRRVNSVNSVAAGSMPLPEKIAMAEAIYARWGRRAIFRITPLAEKALDQMLADRGYVSEGPSYVQTAATAPFPVSDHVRVFARAEDEWIEAAWVLIRDSAAPAALGAVGIERGWSGLHGIYVAAQARGRGLARLVSEALIGFAHAKGARRAWLQVEQTNARALPLYASLGYETCYSYHYRVQRA